MDRKWGPTPGEAGLQGGGVGGGVAQLLLFSCLKTPVFTSDDGVSPLMLFHLFLNPSIFYSRSSRPVSALILRSHPPVLLHQYFSTSYFLHLLLWFSLTLIFPSSSHAVF